MERKVQDRRDALKTRLIDIARERIAQDGLASLRARDLAKEAECSVGAIYNVFGDLNDLILTVNERTFRELGAHVADRLARTQQKSPTERLITMSYAYLDYAQKNPTMWRALFDVQMSTDVDPQQWYLDELSRLFAIIAEQVVQCYPEMDQEEAGLMTRALFSSVHGIVLLGIESRNSADLRPELRRMIALLLLKATGTT